MSDYREVTVIVNVIGAENIMSGETARMVGNLLPILVSKTATVEEVMREVEKRVLAIEDVL